MIARNKNDKSYAFQKIGYYLEVDNLQVPTDKTDTSHLFRYRIINSEAGLTSQNLPGFVNSDSGLIIETNMINFEIITNNKVLLQNISEFPMVIKSVTIANDEGFNKRQGKYGAISKERYYTLILG
jgi:hypothetical protein